MSGDIQSIHRPPTCAGDDVSLLVPRVRTPCVSSTTPCSSSFPVEETEARATEERSGSQAGKAGEAQPPALASPAALVHLAPSWSACPMGAAPSVIRALGATSSWVLSRDLHFRD